MPVATVSIYQHQHAWTCDLDRLEQITATALPLCLLEAQPHSPLASLTEIEISIVSDDAIARVHGEFMNDPSATDVITFHHGEILVSADTAVREGPAHGNAIDRELALYMIHGLLHLAGWDDHDPEEARQMHELQARLLEAVFPSPASGI